MDHPRLTNPALDWAILAVLVAIWGSAFAGLKIASGALSPIWLATLRLCLGAITLAALAVVRGERPPPLGWGATSPWPWYVAVGVISSALPFVLFAFAAGQIDSGLVAILNGAAPAFTLLLAGLLLGKEGARLDARAGIGVACGFSGLVLLAGKAGMGGLGPGGVAAVAAGVCGAACYALGNVLIKRAPGVSPIIGALIFCASGALAMAPLAALEGDAPLAMGWPAALAILGLGVGATGVASALYVLLIERRGPVFTSFITYLTPLWAAGIGIVFLGEQPSWTAAGALALILGGVAIANGKRG